MSQENVEVVRRIFEAFEAGLARGEPFGESDLGSHFHRDAEWIPASEAPGPSSYRGRQGFVEFSRNWADVFEGWTLRPERLIDAGDDRVVALVHQAAIGKGSRVPVEARPAIVFEFEHGLVARMSSYLDHQQALEAAGLSE